MTYEIGTEQRRKPHPMSFVSVKLWLHSDMHTWVPSSWTQRMFKVKVWDPSRTLAKEQGSLDLKSDYVA
jgi:hypothetical protein